jgi:hypothetical protein
MFSSQKLKKNFFARPESQDTPVKNSETNVKSALIQQPTFTFTPYHPPREVSNQDTSAPPQQQRVKVEKSQQGPYVPPLDLIERACGKKLNPESTHDHESSETSNREINSEDSDHENRNVSKTLTPIPSGHKTYKLDICEKFDLAENPNVVASTVNPNFLENDHYIPLNGFYSLLRGIKVRNEESREKGPFRLDGLESVERFVYGSYPELIKLKDIRMLKIVEKERTSYHGNSFERSKEIFKKLKKMYSSSSKKKRPKAVACTRKSRALKYRDSDQRDFSQSGTAITSKKRKTEDIDLFTFEGPHTSEWISLLKGLKELHGHSKSGNAPSKPLAFVLDKCTKEVSNANFSFKHMKNKPEIEKVLNNRGEQYSSDEESGDIQNSDHYGYGEDSYTPPSPLSDL